MDIFLAGLFMLFMFCASPKGSIECVVYGLIITSFLGAITAINIYG